MVNKNLIIGVLACVALGVGMTAGATIGKNMTEHSKEYAVVNNFRDLKREPYVYAKPIDFNIDRKEKPQVIERLDYAQINNGKPTVVKVNTSVSVKDEASGRQFQLQQDKYYKVVSYPDGDYLKLDCKTDKGENVKLNIKKIDVNLIEVGKWEMIRYKTGHTAWIKK